MCGRGSSSSCGSRCDDARGRHGDGLAGLGDRVRPTRERHVTDSGKRAVIKNRRVALLRGINVGTAKRVAMADLRQLIESLGCTDVKTLLNSGNVVFTEPKAGLATADKLQLAIATRIKVACRVMVIT